VVSGVTAILRMLKGREDREGLLEVDERGHLALVDAAEGAGAERFVFVSAAGMEKIPRVALVVGSRALARVKPELSTLMGLSLMLDSGDVLWDDAPLRELGIEPRSPREFIRQAVSQDS
jgi:hypothetical protein